MKRTRKTIAVLLLCLSCSLGALSGMLACTTTPLPMPPSITADVENIDISDHEGGALVTGSDGATDPGGESIRVSYGGEEIDAVPPQLEEVVTGDDGSFQVWVRGNMTSRFYIEHLQDDADLFIIAIRGGADSPSGTSETDPGADSDGDGSPDLIDCDPDDDAYGGQRCP